MSSPPGMRHDTDERRRHARINIVRPAKIYDPRGCKYIGATTRDLSTHGLMLEIERPVALKPGDEILVGVAMDDRQAIIESKELTEAVVVRSLQTEDERTTIAVRLVDRHQAETAWPRMAA